MTRRVKNRRNSGVTKAILKAFIPYSRENLMLAYKPNSFFNHLEALEKQTGASRNTLRVTIDRAKRAGLLKVDLEKGILVTTWRGKIKASLKPQAKTKQYLVIAFDVPENLRRQRDTLRAYLRSTYAQPVQKSLWKTRYDIHDELNEVITELGLNNHVIQFMADEV